MELVIKARRRSLGGFDVGRVLPFAGGRMVGPFIFFDHMGPAVFPPGIPHDADVRPHPHIGLATITYLLDGEITHRDSLGVEQPIRPGEVNWMTAGRGITHSERFDGMRAAGGLMDGIQTWVALPEGEEEAAPRFDHLDEHQLPSWIEDRASIRLLAGSAFGASSPVKTYSPLFYAHARAEKGSCLRLPEEHPERAIYIARGRIEAEGKTFGHGDMLIFASGARPELVAAETSDVMLLGGSPVGPRRLWWNFVSSRPDRIEQAKADWKAGRFTLPPNDKDEFIPLPEEPPPPRPEPMS